ncbi:23723_t:CDS:2, partial [Racocetra persica]
KSLTGGKLNKTAEIENYPGFALIQGPELAAKIKALNLEKKAIENNLGVPGEKEFTNHGVAYCAICDGWLFRGQSVAVVGGGYSSLETSLYMSNIASRVYLIHRRANFRTEREIVEKVEKNPKITLIINSVIKEIHGQGKVEKIIIRNLLSEKENELLVSAVFP